MAKWGEGDPRWIVEERPDATNVNNWHWTERNAGPWSTERLKELFKDLIVPSDVGELKVTEVEKVDGEASANNRKGKLIFFFEWNLVLKWEGRLKECENLIEGKITIPNLSEENDISEVDITVTVGTSNEEAEVLKAVMHSVGRDHIRKQLANYVSGLREEFSQGMILPRKDEDSKSDSISNLSSGFNKKINMTPVVDNSAQENNKNVPTTQLKLTQKFQCSGQEVFDALTTKQMVGAWTRGAVDELDAVVGGKFSLFGGNVNGKFTELVAPKRIVQSWRYKQWPAGHYSTVTFEIDQKKDHTEISIRQVGVPKSEADVTRDNWERYYWDSIKRTFGWGAFFDYT